MFWHDQCLALSTMGAVANAQLAFRVLIVTNKNINIASQCPKSSVEMFKSRRVGYFPTKKISIVSRTTRQQSKNVCCCPPIDDISCINHFKQKTLQAIVMTLAALMTLNKYLGVVHCHTHPITPLSPRPPPCEPLRIFATYRQLCKSLLWLTHPVKYYCFFVYAPLPRANVRCRVQCRLKCDWNATGWPSVHWDTTGRPSEYCTVHWHTTGKK